MKKEKNGDEEFALFMTKFKTCFKKEVLRITRSKFNKRKPRRACCHCGEYDDYFISDCPYEKRSDKDKDKDKDQTYNKKSLKKEKSQHKKYSVRAHIRQEWDSNQESSSDEECGCKRSNWHLSIQGHF